MGVMINLSGGLFWVLRRWLSLFQIILLGSIIAWAGLIAAAFSPNMAWLTVSYGGLYGVGLGINTLSTGMLITIYFDEYRGIASGIRYVGLSLSSLIFPPILPYAQKEYGFRGTLFLCGAMTMNTTAFTFALKEPRQKKMSGACAYQ
uniref:Putative monocarboxylate transporter n=1 Tax=Ixodes ricinus TaxID=34613 RepID=A0A131YCA4_IXORI